VGDGQRVNLMGGPSELRSARRVLLLNSECILLLMKLLGFCGRILSLEIANRLHHARVVDVVGVLVFYVVVHWVVFLVVLLIIHLQNLLLVHVMEDVINSICSFAGCTV